MDTFKNTQNITKCNNNNYIRVVKITQNGLCRTLLHKEICSINNFGQIILPKDYYSAGYYERLTDSHWENLPNLNS